MQIIGAIKSQGYGIITQEALLKILKTHVLPEKQWQHNEDVMSFYVQHPQT